MLSKLSGFADSTVVFDLDGTIVESLPDLAATLNVILSREGVPCLPQDSIRALVGQGARALLIRGFEAAGVRLSPDRADALFRDFIAYYSAHVADRSFVFPGVEAALDRLAAGGAKLAICTNKRTDLAVALLRAVGLADRFAAIVGPDLAPAAKPDGRHVLKAVSLAGGDHRRAIMVGDSRADADAARAAGLPVILVTFGYTDIPVHDLSPDVLITHFDDLPQACEQLLAACPLTLDRL